MELTSALTLEMLGKPFILEKRIVLLHAIQEHGSISKAAKVVPMSYKSAWEAVDMMNSLSPEPIVTRETGGKDGGGTTITAYGIRLLENYDLLKSEHTHFLKRLSTLTDIKSGTFKTMGRLSLQLSARNQIQAKVISIAPHNLNAMITLELKSGQRITSTITQEAVQNMHIEEGDILTALFKSSAVEISGNQNDEHCLVGTISTIQRNEENIKISVDIGAYDKIISVKPSHILEHIHFIEGNKVYIQIKDHDVMLGK